MGKRERGLGRGLNALLSVGPEDETAQIMEMALDGIVPRKDQPRQHFDEQSLQELAESIREHGVLQPVLVRPLGDLFEIVAGERRWRAAGIAGLKTVPVMVRDMSDLDAAEISLIENLQRSDLSAIEEAVAYRRLMDKHSYTQEILAEKIGKSRAHIANTVRLLGLPGEVIKMIEEKRITAGHARAIVTLGDATAQIAAAQEIAQGGLTVRQVEEKVKKRKTNKKTRPTKSPELIEFQERLQRHLGTRADISFKGGGGKIEIEYYNQEDLERILEIIGLF